MENRAALITSLGLVALAAGVSLWGWFHIPDTAHVAVHWGLNGKVNGWWSKPAALAFGPLMALGLTAFFAITPFIYPLRRNMRGNPAYVAGWVGAVLLIAGLHGAIVLHAAGAHVNVAGSAVFMAGLLMAAIGNFLGKARRNWVVGVRTPWTLSSDYAWDKSNRLAGWLLVATGLLTVAAVAVFGTKTGAETLAVGVLSMAVVATAASYIYWRADPEREN